ncbi:MAG: hypothetical protein KKE23_01290 [Nanoarchaeota archaeon]|nr:hypothetical protein [Nanoarchaeota archaeon]
MKKGAIIFGAILSAVSASSLALAQNLPAPPVTLNDLSMFLNSIFSADFGTGLAAKLLLFLLLAVVLYKPAEKIAGGSSNIGMTISVVISLMAVKFLTPEIARGLFLPYEALGVVLSIFIPFILFGAFMITSDLPKVVRNIGWFMLGGLFIYLWFVRWTDIGDLAWYYLVATVMAVLGAAFDGTLHRLWYNSKIQRREGVSAGIQINILLDEITALYTQMGKTSSNTQRNTLARQIKAKEDAIKKLQIAAPVVP